MLKKLVFAIVFVLFASFITKNVSAGGPTSCDTSVTSIEALTHCEGGSGMEFASATYSCAGFPYPQTISRGYCVNIYDLFQAAVDACTNVCVIPSPSTDPYSTTPPSAPPACTGQTVTYQSFVDPCPNMVDGKPQYHFIDYKCGNEQNVRRSGSATSCSWGHTLLDTAYYYCRQNSCTGSSTPPSATPTPTPTPRVSPSPLASSSVIIKPTYIPSPTAIQTTIPSPYVYSCGKNLSNWMYRESCGRNPVSYRYFDFQCAGDTKLTTLGSLSSCKTESAWVEEAKNICRTRPCSSPVGEVVQETVVSPSTIARPTNTRPTFSCYSSCYFKKWFKKSSAVCADVCRGI